MNLDQEIVNALIKIQFVEKYESISNSAFAKYNAAEEKIGRADPKKITELLETAGMNAKFIKKEKFYKTEDICIGNYSFRMHFAFNYDFTECIWVVHKNNILILGSPLGVLPRLLVSPNFRIKPPKYSNYDDILIIVKQLKSLFNELQNALVETEDR